MADVGFGSWGEDGFGEFLALFEVWREVNAADFAGALVIFPAGSGDISASDAFDGYDLSFSADHDSVEEVELLIVGDGERFGRGFEDMVVDDAEFFDPIKPIERYFGEEYAFSGKRVGHDDVEGAEAVGGDDKEPIGLGWIREREIVEIPDFSLASIR